MKPNNLLKGARERAKMTQEQLAAEADVSQASISAFERGAYCPPADVLSRIRHALDVRHNYEIGYDVIISTRYEVRRIDG